MEHDNFWYFANLSFIIENITVFTHSTYVRLMTQKKLNLV